MNKKVSRFTRRELIKSAALAGLGGAMMPLTGFTGTDQKKKTFNLIEAENSEPGTLEWRLSWKTYG
jgi:hypothetical protein